MKSTAAYYLIFPFAENSLLYTHIYLYLYYLFRNLLLQYKCYMSVIHLKGIIRKMFILYINIL